MDILHNKFYMNIDISEPYFYLICSDIKTLECRKMFPKWKHLCVNDVLTVMNPHNSPYYIKIV